MKPITKKAQTNTEFSINDLCEFCRVDVMFPLAEKHYKSCCDVTIVVLENSQIRVYKGREDK